MKTILAILSLAIIMASCQHSGKPKILVFTKTAGYHHSSVKVGAEAIQRLGAENNFAVDTTSDAAQITEDSLKQYAAVVFLNTTGDLLNHYQEADLERFIQAGGGFVGVHAAADAEYDWAWYGRMVGGYFSSHPEQQEAVLTIKDDSHISTNGLPSQWKRKDEWYNFKKLNKDVHVLMTIDEKSYKGGTNGDNHPVAWYHEFDGGRSFYTALGHTEESYSDPLFLKHLLGGIQYAIGDNKLDYSKAKSVRPPAEEHFVKQVLVAGEFFEPVEMAILPNLDILVCQRRGEIYKYSKSANTLKQVGKLNVYFLAKNLKVHSEEGLLGIQIDPDFANNHYVYIYYSPVDSAVDRLSRFTFENDTINPATEKSILEVKVQREICCHTGGSLAFGANRELFLSVGDNTTPFDEPNQKYNLHSFSPLDDRPGFQQYDDRRAAGNTNDLRGKILRVIVGTDGKYSIPANNLFANGTEKTRPEIYVMGNRNPYRISVDKTNGFLYWGEVGPDANKDSLETRGPRGYDEINQAQKAGNFGWPYFVGDNYAYHEYDYATGIPGPAFKAEAPLNHSKNNTGLVQLPPAQPAFIWYPYAQSNDFPQLGTGGRTAMAGPVYHAAQYDPATRMNEYYDGKFFIYDFIRGWIKAVSLQPDGSLEKIEPFMSNTKFNSIIDMEMGPDGKLYLLEYGNGWFTKNKDASISVITYTDKLPVKENPAVVAPDIKVDSVISTGRALVQTLDCKSCHKEAEKSIGPSFLQVAEKYGKDHMANDYLKQKIIKGGSGVWGDVAMPGHPDLKEADLKHITDYILKLSAK